MRLPPDCRQPELLAGKRYNEDVDAYSFGVVLFEIAACRLPYARRREVYKKKGGKGLDMKMMREISLGLLKPELAGEIQCKRFRVGGAFKKRRFSALVHGACFALALDLPAHHHYVKMPLNSLQALREI